MFTYSVQEAPTRRVFVGLHINGSTYTNAKCVYIVIGDMRPNKHALPYKIYMYM